MLHSCFWHWDNDYVSLSCPQETLKLVPQDMATSSGASRCFALDIQHADYLLASCAELTWYRGLCPSLLRQKGIKFQCKHRLHS